MVDSEKIVTKKAIVMIVISKNGNYGTDYDIIVTK